MARKLVTLEARHEIASIKAYLSGPAPSRWRCEMFYWASGLLRDTCAESTKQKVTSSDIVKVWHSYHSHSYLLFLGLRCSDMVCVIIILCIHGTAETAHHKLCPPMALVEGLLPGWVKTHEESIAPLTPVFAAHQGRN